VAIDGSGRTADVFANALAGEFVDERVATLVRSALIRSVPADEPEGVARLLEDVLRGGGV
jgi:hypothetical protein